MGVAKSTGIHDQIVMSMPWRSARGGSTHEDNEVTVMYMTVGFKSDNSEG